MITAASTSSAGSRLVGREHSAAHTGFGECDEPIPYPENVEFNVFVDFACCCDFCSDLI